MKLSLFWCPSCGAIKARREETLEEESARLRADPPLPPLVFVCYGREHMIPGLIPGLPMVHVSAYTDESNAFGEPIGDRLVFEVPVPGK